MRKLTISLFLVVGIAALSLATSPCSAQLRYGFSERTTGNLLATMELATLPANPADILSLKFTPEGQALFGYGPNYLGAFDTAIAAPIQGLANGLRGGPIHDDDPPASTFHPTGTGRVNLSFEAFANNDDAIIVTAVQPRMYPDRIAIGNWLVVPEPHSALLAAVGFLTAMFTARVR